MNTTLDRTFDSHVWGSFAVDWAVGLIAGGDTACDLLKGTLYGVSPPTCIDRPITQHPPSFGWPLGCVSWVVGWTHPGWAWSVFAWREDLGSTPCEVAP